VTATAELQLGLALAERSADARARLVAELIPIARELAERAAEQSAALGCVESMGVTVADVRVAAARRGLLPQQGQGRTLSFLGAVMKRAGLRATDRVRRSHVPGTHGNANRIYTLPEPGTTGYAAVRAGAML
jgi:hypothetical protein